MGLYIFSFNEKVFFKNHKIINQIINLDSERRTKQAELDKHLDESNRMAKEIGKLFKAGEIKKANVIKEKSLYGRKYMGIDRSTFLINREMEVLNVWRNVKVKGHVEEVIRFIKEL